jgi:hypothetical protein
VRPWRSEQNVACLPAGFRAGNGSLQVEHAFGCAFSGARLGSQRNEPARGVKP